MPRHANGFELQPIAQRQVDVPFLIMATDSRHLKAGLLKSLIDLIAHLEAIETDTWAYLGHHLLRLRAIRPRHLGDSSLYDALYSPPPASVNGTDGLMLRVVEQYRDTVGCRDTDAYVADISHQGIHTLQLLLLFASRQIQKRLINGYHFCQMNLMWHQQPIVADLQQFTQRLTVLCDGFGLIATVTVDIEFTIVPLTITSTTGGAKGCDAFAKVIITEFWMYHFCMFCLQRYEKKVIKQGKKGKSHLQATKKTAGLLSGAVSGL